MFKDTHCLTLITVMSQLFWWSPKSQKRKSESNVWIPPCVQHCLAVSVLSQIDLFSPLSKAWNQCIFVHIYPPSLSLSCSSSGWVCLPSVCQLSLL